MDFINHLLPESQASLAQLDLFLHILHSGLILFMLFGAFFRSLVPLHFLLVVIIWISWIGIGLYVHYLGYCILTDWHWQVKAREGEINLPPSYITYLYGKLTGYSANNKLITYLTGGVMVLITIFSAYRFFRRKNDRALTNKLA